MMIEWELRAAVGDAKPVLFVESRRADAAVVPIIGSIVTARITKIQPLRAVASILCVADKPLRENYAGIIRKKLITERSRDHTEQHAAVDVAATEADCERIFSWEGYIHNKRSNALKPALVEKMVFIHTNFEKLFAGPHIPPSQVEEVEYDAEEPEPNKT
ncbi:hypothetical protein Pelo_18551 [Pelomyxa schiedti]|nr:hypothetical protein Pelo_18551 [Pelomyxa schiedti]